MKKIALALILAMIISSALLLTSCMDKIVEVAKTELEFRLNDEGDGYIVTGYNDFKNPKEIVIPSEHEGLPVVAIGYNAFIFRDSLEKVVIPGSVKFIVDGAFKYCSALNTVVLGNGVETIYSGVFDNCHSLEHINIPASVNEISHTAFLGCTKLIIDVDEKNEKYKIVDGNLYQVGDSYRAEDNSSITSEGWVLMRYSPLNKSSSFSIPKEVEKIDEYAFFDYNSIKHIGFEEGTNIQTLNKAFSYIETLESIVIPDSVTTISNYAFSNCTLLKTVTFGENSQLSFIDYCAFEGCRSLTDINIPDSVIEIQSSVFKDCVSLEYIDLPDALEVILHDTFMGCTSLKSIVIPNHVKQIFTNSFSGCTSLESITLPDTLEFIGEGAFRNCSSLESLFIPKKANTIRQYAFYGCDNVTLYFELSYWHSWMNHEMMEEGTPSYWGCTREEAEQKIQK